MPAVRLHRWRSQWMVLLAIAVMGCVLVRPAALITFALLTFAGGITGRRPQRH
jgi:hypothetical protein